MKNLESRKDSWIFIQGILFLILQLFFLLLLASGITSVYGDDVNIASALYFILDLFYMNATIAGRVLSLTALGIGYLILLVISITTFIKSVVLCSKYKKQRNKLLFFETINGYTVKIFLISIAVLYICNAISATRLKPITMFALIIGLAVLFLGETVKDYIERSEQKIVSFIENIIFRLLFMLLFVYFAYLLYKPVFSNIVYGFSTLESVSKYTYVYFLYDRIIDNILLFYMAIVIFKVMGDYLKYPTKFINGVFAIPSTRKILIISIIIFVANCAVRVFLVDLSIRVHFRLDMIKVFIQITRDSYFPMLLLGISGFIMAHFVVLAEEKPIIAKEQDEQSAGSGDSSSKEPLVHESVAQKETATNCTEIVAQDKGTET